MSFLSSSNSKETKEEDGEDEVDESSSKSHTKLQSLMERMEGRKKKKRKNMGCWELMNELKGVHHHLISPFLHLSPHHSIIYILSQMKGHLSQFTSNGIAHNTEVNVLLEIHTWVCRVSEFDEIRGNSYLRKSPRITLF